MGLYAQPEKWLNDPRLLYHDGVYHLFHLQGPRDLPKPPYEEMAHATSTDLLNWQASELLLPPGEPGSWDDRAVWTSGYVFYNGRYYTLYTGLCDGEGGRIQRLGLATSADLKSWERHPANPVLEADPRYYESDPDDSPDYDHIAWRDPWLWHNPDDSIFYAFITGRLNHGPGDARGCVALAKSPDLAEWECLPPAYAPGREVYHEVPELFPWQGKWVLLFGSKDEGLSMKYIVSDDPLRWDSNDPGKMLIGSVALMEYSVTTAVRGDGRDVVHLVYEWHTEHPDHPRVRGRVSLPKTLAGGPDNLHLRLREDLAPGAEDRLDAAELAATAPDRWQADGTLLKGQPQGEITRVSLAGKGPRTVAVNISSTDSGEAGFVIGKDEVVVGLHSDRKLVARTTGIEGERTWDTDAEGELAVALVGRHADVYFNRRYLGTVCAVAEGDKSVALYCSGTGEFSFADISSRPIRVGG